MLAVHHPVARACAVTEAAGKQVKELNQRLHHKHITLELTDAALDYAVEQSFDHLCAASAPCMYLSAKRTRDCHMTHFGASVLAAERGVPRGGRRYGARPLRRWMEKTILTDLSRMLVSGELAEYAAVVCDVAPDRKGLVYKVEKAEPAPGVPEQQDAKRARWAGATKLDEEESMEE